MKKAICILLSLVCLLPMLVFEASAEESALEVEYYNDLRGSAAGMYTFSAAKSGNFGLYYADADGNELTTTVGGRELSYTAFTDFAVKNPGKYYFEPNSFTAIPYGAKKLIVTQRGGTLVASFDIPAEKQLENDYRYAYGVLSDLHYNSFTYNGADAAIGAVDNAFDFYKSVGVQNVFTTGDYSSNEDEDAYKKFSAAIDRSGLTVISCGGNHEVINGSTQMFGKNGFWYKYTNKGVYDGKLDGVLEIAPNGFDFVYEIPGTDDVFISVSQTRWDGRTVSQKPLIEEDAVQWMGSVFEKYKDKNMHLLMHTYLSDDDHENIDGSGDITNDVGYGYHYHWNVHTDEENKLRQMLDQNEGLIWFNGHSHWCYYMQQFNINLNIFDYGGTSATYVHVPSVTAPRTVSATGTAYSSNAGTRSEGALMLSCDGYELMNGIDFKTGNIYPYACYIIYKDKTVTGDLEGGKASWTYDAQSSQIRITGTGKLPDFASIDKQPWARYAQSVRTVYIAQGIENIGANSFSGMPLLNKVEIKEGVKSIGASAFEGDGKIKTLLLPESLQSVKEKALSGLGSDTTVYFAGSEEKFKKIAVAAGNDRLAEKIDFGTCLISFKVGQYVKTEEAKIGVSPVYNDVKAMPKEEGDGYLRFAGWSIGRVTYDVDKTLPKASKNVVYTATFKEEPERYVGGSVACVKESDKVEWSLDLCTGVLTLSGKGTTANFKSDAEQPWTKYKNEIYTVIVKSGVLGVGAMCFTRLPALKTAIFESGVRSFGADCFSYCSALTEVYLPKSLATVSQGACYNCENLGVVHYAGDDKDWKKLYSRFSVYNDAIKESNNVIMGADAPTEKENTVTFVDAEGKVIKEYTGVSYNGSVLPPEAPLRENAEFLGWDGAYFVVRGDMTIAPVYKENEPDEPETPTPAVSDTTGADTVTNLPAESEAKTEPAGTETVPETQQPSGANVGLIIGIAAGVIAAAAVVVVVIVRKKKK